VCHASGACSCSSVAQSGAQKTSGLRIILVRYISDRVNGTWVSTRGGLWIWKVRPVYRLPWLLNISVLLVRDRFRFTVSRFHGSRTANHVRPVPDSARLARKYCRMPRPVRGIVWRYASQSRFGQLLVPGLKLGGASPVRGARINASTGEHSVEVQSYSARVSRSD
jgi:hypothetical protein